MTPVLESDNRVPHGGMFRVVDPATGAECLGNTFESLMGRVIESRKSNGYPIGVGLREEIEAIVCRDWPNECQGWDEQTPRKRALTVMDIVHGSRAMLSIWWKNKPLVTRQEAETRAQTCIRCPMHTRFDKSCSGLCKEIKEVVNAVIDHQGTQYDSQLKSCGICACFLQAGIWVDRQVQWDALTDNQRAQFMNLKYPCWKRPELTS